MMMWGIAANQSFWILTVLFFILCAQIFYLIWMWETRRSRGYRILACWFVLLFAGFAVLFDTNIANHIPVVWIWILTGAQAAAMSAVTAVTYKRNRQRITRGSIKEAMDELPASGCYFTAGGSVKLCNRQMYRLFHMMTGKDLQTLQELYEALSSCPGGIYRAEDGSVWKYYEEQIAADGNVYTEAVFTDITEIDRINAELKQDNKALNKVNRKLKKMYARAEDSIREREYLTFKLKIHDGIGQSLAVLRKALQGGAAGERQKVLEQIRRLSVAVGTLIFNPDADSVDDYDVLLSECADLGVELRLDGMLPMEPLIYNLTVMALRECVTNCVRHAKGALVEAKIKGVPGGYTIRITNDGEAPKGEIKEGSGLGALRKSIENAGGEMQISHYPAFSMSLTFMREEMDL